MMNVVIVRRIPADHLQRVPGQIIPAMVINGFACREEEKECGLADSQTGEGLGERSTQRVEEEALEGVVVESAERVRDVESVVYRVKVLVEEFVDVHGTMEEILPCVHDEAERTTMKTRKR